MGRSATAQRPDAYCIALKVWLLPCRELSLAARAKANRGGQASYTAVPPKLKDEEERPMAALQRRSIGLTCAMRYRLSASNTPVNHSAGVALQTHGTSTTVCL